MAVINGQERKYSVKFEPQMMKGARVLAASPEKWGAALTDLNSLMPETMDQGRVSDCLCNMGCEQMEFLGRKVGNLKLFSRLHLYANVRKFEGTPLEVDSGGMISSVQAVLETQGVCYEDTWNYDDADVRYSLDPPPECDIEGAEHKAILTFATPDIDTIRASLGEGFPVGFGILLAQSFESSEVANGAIYAPTFGENHVGGHAMTVVGNDDKFEIPGYGKGAFDVRNSWGEDWGRKGNVWIPYRLFEDGTVSQAMTIRAAQV